MSGLKKSPPASRFLKLFRSRKPEISNPFDFAHVTHIGWDFETGGFTGMPQEWRRLLEDAGISRLEQDQNVEAIQQIFRFYETAGNTVDTFSGSTGASPGVSGSSLDWGGPTVLVARASPLFPPTTPRVISPPNVRPANPGYASAPASPRASIGHLDPLPSFTGRDDLTVASDSIPVRQILADSDTQDILESLSSFVISPDRLEFAKGDPEARGGFGDVRRAVLRPVPTEGARSGLQAGPSKTAAIVTPKVVAVKELRFPRGLPIERAKKRFAREGTVWAGLAHPNILPFVGYHFDEERSEAWLICPWQPNGSVSRYLARRSPDLGERLVLVMDTAKGLEYLHSHVPPICHGDIKAANVLVNDDTRAMLCDFGLAKVLDDEMKGLTTTDSFKGSIPWCSPELFDEALRNEASDMWAWGWLVWEIMTGKMPFPGDKAPTVLMFKILTGKLPDLDTEAGFSLVPQLAALVRRCWTQDPKLRATITDVLATLRSQVVAPSR